MNKTIWIGFLLLAAALVIAACGKDDPIDKDPLLTAPIPFPPPSPIPYTGVAAGVLTSEKRTLETAVVLARFSAGDAVEGEQRADAARELMTQLNSDGVDTGKVLVFLDTIAPGASIKARREAADRMAALSDVGNLTPRQQMEATNEITRLITGNELNAEQRINAADELVRRLDEGELDAESALDLVNTIAPETGIKARAEALNALTTEYGQDDWDDEKRMNLANDVYKLATGEELNVEERIDGTIDATVDIGSEALKAVSNMESSGGDAFDADEIDAAAKATKDLLKGDTESVRELVLETDDSKVSHTGEYVDVCTSPPKGFSEYFGLTRDVVQRRAQHDRPETPGCGSYTYTKFAPYESMRPEEIGPFIRMAKVLANVKTTKMQDPLSYVFDKDEVINPSCRSEYWGGSWSLSGFCGDAYDYARIYIDQREEGKPHIFAHLFAWVRVGILDLRPGNYDDHYTYTINYIQQRLQGRPHGETRVYASLREAGESHEFATAYIYYLRYVGPGWAEQNRNSVHEVYARVYAEQIVSGKSAEYAYYYVYGRLFMYNLLHDLRRYADDTALCVAPRYAEQRELGNHHGYAYYYTYASCIAEVYTSQKYAIAYAEQRAQGKSHEYAALYAEQRQQGKSHEEASGHAEGNHTPGAYYDALTAQIAEGKSHEYATSYAEQIEQGKSVTEAHEFARWAAEEK